MPKRSSKGVQNHGSTSHKPNSSENPKAKPNPADLFLKDEEHTTQEKKHPVDAFLNDDKPLNNTKENPVDAPLSTANSASTKANERPSVSPENESESRPNNALLNGVDDAAVTENIIESANNKLTNQKTSSINSNSSGKKKRKKLLIIIASIVAILAIAAATITVAYQNSIEEEKVYAENMEEIIVDMLDGAAKAESAGSLFKDVWYNSIWEEHDKKTDKYTMKNGKFFDDFNDALSNLQSDPSFIKKINKIENRQQEVIEKMQKLSNPPKKYEAAHQTLQDYYDAFISFTNLVTTPNGSLNSFSEDFNKRDSEVLDQYAKMKPYLFTDDED